MAIYFRSDGWVKSSVGPSVPGAQIYVCSQPANVTFLPPTPISDIFSDPSGLVPIVQPILTDGFGHYDFYVLPGFYTIVVGLGGRIQQVYPDQAIGTAGSSVSSLVLQVNGVPNINQNLLNLKNTPSVTFIDNGDGSIGANVAGTGLALKTNSVPNVNQAILNIVQGSGISAVDNGAGAVTLTNTLPGSGGDFSFASVHGWSAAPGAFTTADFPRLGMSFNGGNSTNQTVLPPTATEGTAYIVTTGAIPGQFGQLVEDSLANTQDPPGGPHTGVYSSSFGSLLTMQGRLKISALDATDLVWYGMGDNIEFSPYFTTDPITPYSVLFRADGLSGQWHIYCSNDSLSTDALTGVALDTNYHTFKITFGAGTATFFIDGVNVGTLNTNYPPATGSPANMLLVYNPTILATVTATILYSWWQTD